MFVVLLVRLLVVFGGVVIWLSVWLFCDLLVGFVVHRVCLFVVGFVDDLSY